MYISDSIHRAANASRASGVIQVLGFGAIVYVMLFAAGNQPAGIDAVRRIIVVLGVLYIIPGIAAWVFGTLLARGHVWAFWVVVLLAVLDLLKLLLTAMFVPVCANIFLRLPTLLLAVFCLNAWSDVRDLYRHRRRARQTRGFEPIMRSAPAHPAPPPPPARQMRAASRPVPRRDPPSSSS